MVFLFPSALGRLWRRRTIACSGSHAGTRLLHPPSRYSVQTRQQCHSSRTAWSTQSSTSTNTAIPSLGTSLQFTTTIKAICSSNAAKMHSPAPEVKSWAVILTSGHGSSLTSTQSGPIVCFADPEGFSQLTHYRESTSFSFRS